MSEDGTMASPPGGAGETQGSGRRLYDSAGEPVRSAAQPQANQASQGDQSSQIDQLATFVREQPLSAALAALIIGYLLGKIT